METTAAMTAAAPAEPVPEAVEPDDERRESLAEELRAAIRRKLEPPAR